MNLPIAEEVLRTLLTDDPQWPPDDRRDAIKLGIEALKVVEEFRTGRYKTINSPLPGETDD